MSDKNSIFNQTSEIAFDEEHWQRMRNCSILHESRIAEGMQYYKNVELERERAYQMRNKSLLNLEKNLIDFETRFTANGGQVIWARHAEDARQKILSIIDKEHCNSVLRSNSGTLDEIGLDDFLSKKKVNVVDTHIGRFIAQMASQPPYHPLYPALNLTKEAICSLFTEQYKLKATSTPKQIVNFTRQKLKADFEKAEICITGANFLVADIGGVVLCENQGNILKSVASSKIHIIVAKLDKVLSNLDDLSLMLPLLSSHATGERMTVYNSITTGPSNEGKGPVNMYVILLDNGCTDVLSEEKQRQALSCIHCGACVTVCPIYQNIGGNAYNAMYMGPIGSVLTPLFTDMKEYGYLTSACAMCGKCVEVCPVKIPIADLIVVNRNIVVDEKLNDAKMDFLYGRLIKMMKSRKKMDRCSMGMKNVLMKHYLKNFWGDRRAMPRFAKQSFSEMWKEKNESSEA